MHVWHHDHDLPADRRFGANFAICLSNVGLDLRHGLLALTRSIAGAAESASTKPKEPDDLGASEG